MTDLKVVRAVFWASCVAMFIGVNANAAVVIRGANVNSHGIELGNTEVATPVGQFAQLPQGLTAGIFQQDIDHTGKLPGQTFSQRYWVDSEFAASSSAPVIYHFCGETDCTQAYFLHDNAIFWAREMGARLVYLEHRYYGRSVPFSNLSAAHLKYLTLANVLGDLATFQKWISKKNGWTGPWIAVGGSYSGTLAALYRFKYPNLVVGALAASAPMESGVGNLEGTQQDVDGLSSTALSQNLGGDRQWTYESCTKFGFWMANYDYWTGGYDLMEPSPWLCHQLFGNVTLYNSQSYNQKYYEPFISNAPNAPSNILFTYGSADIWTNIGLPVNGVANPNITVHLIEGAGHHFDLNYPSQDDSQSVLNARVLFYQMAEQWIQNYNQTHARFYQR